MPTRNGVLTTSRNTKTILDSAKTFYFAKKCGINKLAAGRMRIRYLLEQIDEESCCWFTQEANEKMMDEVLYIIKNMWRDFEPKKNDITDEDIESARNYPIENLIAFRNGKSAAWCHTDKQPSLTHWKKANKARCFPCDKTYDPISVLMERDGYNFIDAVKALRC
jgi:hypothetical protein